MDEQAIAQQADEILLHDLKDRVFTRQLAEVYLLIDNVSSVSSKQMPKAPLSNELFTSAFANPNAWLSEICAIPWPPHIKRADRDHQAAKVVCARDLLNEAAAPANGATIAFTQLVLNRVPILNGPGWLWRLFHAKPKPATAEQGEQQTQTPSPMLATAISFDPGEMASLAYPGMVSAAFTFRILTFVLIGVLIFWTAMTFSLSWTVAAGNTMLADFRQAASEVTSARQHILIAQQPAGANGAAQASAIPQPAVPSANEAQHDAASETLDRQTGVPGLTPDAFCGDADKSTTNPLLQSLAHHKLCEDLLAADTHLNDARADLAQWSHQERRWFELAWLAAVRPGRDPLNPGEAGRINAEWISAWLQVMGNVILPIFYGVIGAGAAVARNLAGKVRDTLLTPRDGILAWINIGLGGIIGGCIGLFITPDATGQTTALGHLSTSALCFLAGFSVEGVFQMLERLASTAFSTQNPAKKT